MSVEQIYSPRSRLFSNSCKNITAQAQQARRKEARKKGSIDVPGTTLRKLYAPPVLSMKQDAKNILVLRRIGKNKA